MLNLTSFFKDNENNELLLHAKPAILLPFLGGGATAGKRNNNDVFIAFLESILCI